MPMTIQPMMKNAKVPRMIGLSMLDLVLSSHTTRYYSWMDYGGEVFQIMDAHEILLCGDRHLCDLDFDDGFWNF